MRERADVLDASGQWPSDDLAALATVGVMRRAVPHEYGGEGLTPLELYLGYEMIAPASLAVALIISQRDSAIGLIDAAASNHYRTELLRRLANDQTFVTIGIAQLTTSRQGGPPALTAEAVEGGYRIDGDIPWSTGAAKSEYVVAGAVLPDRRQILFLLPMNAPGVHAAEPLPLVSLRASWTGSIRCTGVMITFSHLLVGPAEKVLGGRTNTLPLGQAFLATGLCRGGLDLIARHDSPTAGAAHERLDAQLIEVRTELLALSQPGREQDAIAAGPMLRGRCADLALRIVHSAVALYKGSALVAGHPAQRLAREALFLLVWSCPSAVIDCTIDLLSENP